MFLEEIFYIQQHVANVYLQTATYLRIEFWFGTCF